LCPVAAVGCDQLPRPRNGKEGVDGSSPLEGASGTTKRCKRLPFVAEMDAADDLPQKEGVGFVEGASTGSDPVLKRTRGTQAPSRAFWGQVLGTQSGVVLPLEATRIGAADEVGVANSRMASPGSGSPLPDYC
jgi:hypothetical protein